MYRFTDLRSFLVSTSAALTLSNSAVAQTLPEGAPPPETGAPAPEAAAAPELPPAVSTENELAPKALATPKAPTPPWLDNLSLSGGLILYYYQPTQGSGNNNVSVFFASLLLDGKWDHFGLHIEPRFRDSKLRAFYAGTAWLQEAYASASFGPVTVKVGKEYKLLGLFWDNSFYGNVQVYDGLKLDPNYGLSIEGRVGQQLGVDFAAQFFLVDGGTNVSLANRDTLSVPGARRRNAGVVRVAPSYDFEQGKVQLGLSAEHFNADLPGGAEGVTRVALDAKLSYDRFGIWAEGLLQKGRHVTDFPYAGDTSATPPVPGLASGDNRYLLVGAEYGVGPVTLRYNLSVANYDAADVLEIMHVPGLGVQLNEHLSVLAEYVDWTRDADEGKSDVDQSVNVTVNGHF